MISEKISEKIKTARVKAGMTKTEVAKKMGVAYSTYDGYETGYRTPKIETLRRIADALGVTPTYLIGYDEKIVRPEQYTPQQLTELKIEVWEAYQQHMAETTGARARINAAMAQMDEEGQNRVADYAEDILPRYRITDQPQQPKKEE